MGAAIVTWFKRTNGVTRDAFSLLPSYSPFSLFPFRRFLPLPLSRFPLVSRIPRAKVFFSSSLCLAFVVYPSHVFFIFSHFLHFLFLSHTLPLPIFLISSSSSPCLTLFIFFLFLPLPLLPSSPFFYFSNFLFFLFSHTFPIFLCSSSSSSVSSSS